MRLSLKSLGLAAALAVSAMSAQALTTQSLTIDGKDMGPAVTNGAELTLDAGTYLLTWVSGAWSPWSANRTVSTVLTRGFTTGIQVKDEGGTLLFSRGVQPVFATAAAAAAAAISEGPFEFIVPTAGKVFFGYTDGNPGDNRGEFTIEVSAIPLPAGAVLLLTGFGAMVLLRRRQTA